VESKKKTTVKKSIDPVKKLVARKSVGKKPATKKNAPCSLKQQLAQRNAELAITTAFNRDWLPSWSYKPSLIWSAKKLAKSLMHRSLTYHL